MNAGIQGLAADIFKVALVRLDDALERARRRQPAHPAGARRGARRGAAATSTTAAADARLDVMARRRRARVPLEVNLAFGRAGPTPRADAARRDDPTTGSSRSPTTSARPTCATRSPRAPTQEVDFLVDALGLGPGQRVLDVGCGPGRHAHALARRGHRGPRHRHQRSGSSTSHRAHAPAGGDVRAARRPRACRSTGEFDAVDLAVPGRVRPR